MLEKPPGATLAECYALEALAKERGLSLYATWHSREARALGAARYWLADKVVRRLAVTWKEDVRRWHPGQDWLWQPGGFGVFDPGINALAIVTAILPDPIYLTEATLEVPENRQTPIAAALEFAHPGGADVSMVFDWRQEGAQIWTIEAETDAGILRLFDGGALMTVDQSKAPDNDAQPLAGEYPSLYANMARLVGSGSIDMDIAPLRHVADAFLLGRRVRVAPFIE